MTSQLQKMSKTEKEFDKRDVHGIPAEILPILDSYGSLPTSTTMKYETMEVNANFLKEICQIEHLDEKDIILIKDLVEAMGPQRFYDYCRSHYDYDAPIQNFIMSAYHLIYIEDEDRSEESNE